MIPVGFHLSATYRPFILWHWPHIRQVATPAIDVPKHTMDSGAEINKACSSYLVLSLSDPSIPSSSYAYPGPPVFTYAFRAGAAMARGMGGAPIGDAPLGEP